MLACVALIEANENVAPMTEEADLAELALQKPADVIIEDRWLIDTNEHVSPAPEDPRDYVSPWAVPFR